MWQTEKPIEIKIFQKNFETKLIMPRAMMNSIKIVVFGNL